MKRNERTKKGKKHTISVLKNHAIFIIKAPWTSYQLHKGPLNSNTNIHALSLYGELHERCECFQYAKGQKHFKGAFATCRMIMRFLPSSCFTLCWIKNNCQKSLNLVLVLFKNQPFCQQLHTFEGSIKHVSTSCQEFSIECLKRL